MNILKGVTREVSKILIKTMTTRPSSDYAAFKKCVDEAKNIVALTGAGVSADSGIATFRGPAGLWRTHKATDLATPTAFRANPGLVWEFYQWRREIAFNANPNKAHLALANFEQKCTEQGRNFTIITQNVDGLHLRAGSKNVIELHGSLRQIICTKCKFLEENTTNPICEALKGRGDPDIEHSNLPTIPISDLPKCKKCKALVRPYIVWFGENLDRDVLNKTQELVNTCDLFLVIGTSSIVYPAASFASFVVERNQPVAEFNVENEAASQNFKYYFPGKCAATLPKALGVDS